MMNSENKFDREGSRATKDKIVGCLLQSFGIGGIVRELGKWQQFRPIITSQVTVHGQHIVNGAVDALENSSLADDSRRYAFSCIRKQNSCTIGFQISSLDQNEKFLVGRTPKRHDRLDDGLRPQLPWIL